MSQVKQLKEVQGLVSCLFTHEVSKSTVEFDWKGPKIDPEIWRQVLAFFRWTNTEHKSESQVRFFVNTKLDLWTAWAFPQEERTGMSAAELDTDETKKQRSMFSDQEGWIYFGTVHHHCNMGAFQSGTDKANEVNQDGLHITVGDLDKGQYSMHARLYISGFEIVPKMEWFWDVSDLVRPVPKAMRSFMMEGWQDALARKVMTTPPPLDQKFPEVWRTNVIPVKREVFSRGTYGLVSNDHGFGSWGNGPARNTKAPHDFRIDVSLAFHEWLEVVKQSCGKQPGLESVTESEWIDHALECFEDITEIDLARDLIEILNRNDVSAGALSELLTEKRLESVNEEIAEADKNLPNKQIGPKLTEQNSGVSDYGGMD